MGSSINYVWRNKIYGKKFSSENTSNVFNTVVANKDFSFNINKILSYMFSDTFKKAKAMKMKMKIKVKPKKPKIEIRSSFINRESNVMSLEDEEVESTEVNPRYMSSPHSIFRPVRSWVHRFDRIVLDVAIVL